MNSHVTSVHRHECEECGEPPRYAIYLSDRDTPSYWCEGCLPTPIEFEVCPCGCAIPMGSDSYGPAHGDLSPEKAA